jgi:hypothetical protein
MRPKDQEKVILTEPPQHPGKAEGKLNRWEVGDLLKGRLQVIPHFLSQAFLRVGQKQGPPSRNEGKGVQGLQNGLSCAQILSGIEDYPWSGVN